MKKTENLLWSESVLPVVEPVDAVSRQVVADLSEVLRSLLEGLHDAVLSQVGPPKLFLQL